MLVPALMADEAAPKGRINRRQAKQQKRIDQGVQSGQLTEKEANKLEKQQESIARQEERMRESGGKFTAKERAVITQRQNRASRKIYRQKHDNQTTAPK